MNQALEGMPGTGRCKTHMALLLRGIPWETMAAKQNVTRISVYSMRTFPVASRESKTEGWKDGLVG